MTWLNQIVQGVLLGGYYALLASGLRNDEIARRLDAATADPGTLPVAIVVLDRHVTAGCVVNKTALQRLIDSTIQKHAPLGHGSEVAWWF